MLLNAIDTAAKDRDDAEVRRDMVESVSERDIAVVKRDNASWSGATLSWNGTIMERYYKRDHDKRGWVG